MPDCMLAPEGVDNINIAQTGSAFFIGHPFVSTLPGSVVNASYNSVILRTTPILVKPNAQMLKNIALGTLGNMTGNLMSGKIRGGMMQVGAKPNIFTEFLGQQYGHQQATAIDEATNP